MQLSTQSGGHLSLRPLELYHQTEQFAETREDVLLMRLLPSPSIAVSWSFRSSQMVPKQLDLQFPPPALANAQQPIRPEAQA
jgi:hypothetical protein